MKTLLKQTIVALISLSMWYSLMLSSAFAHTSTQLGSAHQTLDIEVNADINMTNLITSYSRVAGYNSTNLYGQPGTQPASIYNTASGAGDFYSMAFYVGHGNVFYVWPFLEQQWVMSGNNSGTPVWDKDIFPYSSGKNIQCVFLWSCQLGDTVGGFHWSWTPYGMPFAWLRNASLSSDGYAFPDGGNTVFLGFNNAAPFLTYEFWSENEQLLPGAPYNFLRDFYYAALLCGSSYSVNQALDYAASRTWGVPDYFSSIAYNGFNYTEPLKGKEFCKMKVYGDGNKHLSNASGATCAMKTATDGCFYVPNIATSYLKVEKVFNNGNITGDQTGGSSPYGETIRYPNGVVDMLDLTFISGKYGLHESQTNWDYMADVKPDRVINILDYCLASSHFTLTGTYSSDLTGITVTFNNGETKTPDIAGFVSIPQGATSFTVKKNNNPIGAMIVFWHNSTLTP